MKKLAIIFSLFALLVGCEQVSDLDQIGQNNTEIENGSAQGGKLPATLSVNVESEKSTRAFVGDDNVSVLWHSGDAVSYFGEAQNAKYAYAGEDGADKVVMELVSEGTEGAIEGNYTYAIYPYTETMTATAVEGGYEFGVTYPATQTYAEGSFGKGANVMVAAKENGSADDYLFRHTGGYFVLKLYGEGVSIKTITLSALNSEVRLAGAATVTALGVAVPTVEMGAEATSVVTLNCGSGVALGANAATATEFWFALPAVTIEGGLKITVTATDNRTFEKQTTKTVNIERGKVQPMAALKFECNVTTPYQLFYTTSNGAKLDLEGLGLDPFDAEIASHTYSNGQGVITFKTPLTTIKANGFENPSVYTPLSTITIPESVTTLENEAFRRTDLTELTIPGTVNTIGYSLVSGCIELKTVTFLPSPTNTPLTLGAEFDGMSNWGTFYYRQISNFNLNRELILVDDEGEPFTPNGKGEGLLEDRELYSWPSLTVTLGEQVKTIHPRMFMGTPLSNITIPASVTEIKEDAFHGCEDLTSITFESGTADLKIGPTYESSDEFGPFYDTALETLVLDRNLVPTYTIDGDEEGLFSEIETLKNVTLGRNVKTIGNRMFLETGITSISIAEGPTQIEIYAFYNCEGLQEITIPGSVNFIGEDAFYDCNNLQRLTFAPSATNATLKITQGFYGSADLAPFYYTPLIHLYIDRNLSYVDDEGAAFTPDADDEYLFSTKGKLLTYVTFGGHVTNVFNNMFNMCTNIHTVTFEAGSQPLNLGYDSDYEDSNGRKGRGLFLASKQLTEVVLNRNINYTFGEEIDENNYGSIIRASVFGGTHSLTNITVGAGVTSLPNYIFADAGLNGQDVILPDGLTTIGKYAFFDARMNGNLYIPASVKTIGKKAFYNDDQDYIHNSITCRATTPPTIDELPFNLTYTDYWNERKPVYVPSESVEAYKSAWSAYSRRVKEIPE